MIRTHIVTGFLGTGKTTAILHLLSQKPAHEKWAVLVNEFGEVGVDGAILEGSGAVVKEVPGGCLCCVSGLPFQMGLNMLIAREKPDVLIIEPTGLGHPRNILQTLQNEHYQSILDIGALVCLLDPRHLSDPRFLDNDVYTDQIAMADVLIANKTDLCSKEDQEKFNTLLHNFSPKKAASAWITQGEIPLETLNAPHSDRLAINPDAHTNQRKEALPLLLPLSSSEMYRRFENQGQGFYSIGWLVCGEKVFSANLLRNWLEGLGFERVKGIVKTDEGSLVLNMRDGILSEMITRPVDESRLEIIHSEMLEKAELESAFLACTV